MEIILFTGIVSFILGASISFILVYRYAPGLILKENASRYDFENTIQRFEASVLEHGWKIPFIHDLQATMLKFGKTVGPVKVYEICHPDLAEKILNKSKERIVSTMMPCRIAIYEKADGRVYVSRMNSGLIARIMGGIINEVMQQAFKENEKMVHAIAR